MYRFYEAASANEPILVKLNYVMKALKKLKQDYQDFTGTDLGQRLDKIESILDENDNLIIQMTEVIEKIIQ